MNVLERLIEDELMRVPGGPPADELRRRARVRRARRSGVVGTVAVAFTVVVVALGAMLQSPASDRVQVGGPTPTTSDQPASTTTIVTPDSTLPLATTAEFPPLGKMLATVTGMVESNTNPKAVVANPISAEIVATTDTKAYQYWGGTTTDTPIYVLQVTGTFVCETCRGPINGPAIRGTSIQALFDADGNGTGFGIDHTARDLSKLGKVYRVQLPD